MRTNLKVDFPLWKIICVTVHGGDGGSGSGSGLIVGLAGISSRLTMATKGKGVNGW